MGRRREEKVDEEYLAQLMGGEAAEKIRVKMPNTKVNEMFAIADQILGGRRVNVVCADGKTRMARIPGKMRRRQYVREGDLIIVWPWDFQDAKADVKHRYNKTQALYLSRKGILPEIVDIFGMGQSDDSDDESSSTKKKPKKPSLSGSRSTKPSRKGSRQYNVESIPARSRQTKKRSRKGKRPSP